MPTTDYLVQSLARATTILTTFTNDDPELSIGEIARRAGLPRSTVHRLVVNLVRLRLLARDPISDRYRLGLLLAELGTIALSRLDLREKALPTMERLAADVGDGVLLSVLDGHWSVYVAKVNGRHGLRLAATVGGRALLHCTATGKTLLAHLPEERIRQLAAETGLPRRTARTITQIEPLLAHLAEIRARGYTVDDGESEEGLAGIAAPVRDARGDVVGALVVAGPSPRLLPSGEPVMAPRVIVAAEEISALLGYRAATRDLVGGLGR